RTPRCSLFPYTTLFRSPNACSELVPLHFHCSTVVTPDVILAKDRVDRLEARTAFLPRKAEEPDAQQREAGAEPVLQQEAAVAERSEEHMSELQSPYDLV